MAVRKPTAVSDSMDLFNLLETRRLETTNQMESMKQEIMKEFKELKEQQEKFHQSTKTDISNVEEAVTDRIETLSTRIDELERWKWIIVGGSVVIGFFLAGGLQMIQNLLAQ